MLYRPRDTGENAMPNHVSVRDIIEDKVPVGMLEIAGWIRTHRQSKRVSFVELSDGTSVDNLQLVVDPQLAEYQAVAAKLQTGASIKVAGELVLSPAKGQKYEFQVKSLQLVGEADPETYPLQKKAHSLEFLREVLHLRPRSATMGAVLRVRSAASFAVHNFFNQRGFYYVHTPIISTSDCEGAGAMFHVSALDPENPPRSNGKIDYTQDFFGEPASLTVSGQLEGEVCATGISRIYTFGPTFRAENSNTTRHLAEFWMIEPEMAFYDLNDNIQLAQDFVKDVIRQVLVACPRELEFLASQEWVKAGHVDALTKLVDSSFTALDYGEAISILQKSGHSFEYPVSWGIDLQSEHERFLTDEVVQGPVTVINYPKEIKAFYMRLNEDGKTVRAMDLLVPRLGEIVGGSQREERHDVLLEKIRAMGLNEAAYWWYLDLRKFGTVPHAGFGLGFERLLMYVTGMQNIRDVIPFPRFPGFAKF
jgi:asparaginyl-tRNA synthetase